MAAVVAPPPPAHTFERLNLVRTHTLPFKDTKRPPDGPEKVRFLPDGLDTGARVLSDGRIDIHIDQHKPNIAGLLNRIQRPDVHPDRVAEQTADEEKPFAKDEPYPLHLNIVIQVIGSRGDIQPFVALGSELKAHGHRVRLATHLTFRQFVLDSGLEFFNIGGDPTELMAFMVKNPGLLPGFKAIRTGEIQKRRREMREIFNGCWRSCFEKGDGTHLHQIKEDPFDRALDFRERPFVADAIIANPPSLAHIHCAQRLGIPLHIIFTSPSLLPKPPDWPENIDVCGFGFLMPESNYTPPPEIAAFLASGPKPIYVGFGSIVVDNPAKLTKIVFEAVKRTGQRALVSKGWGNLGADEVPENILMIGSCPHDWLFRQVSCVIHHGGAGTTAAGLALGRPTIIVPFFGDQQFWGSIVARAGAGPAPIPYKRLNIQNLSDGIQKALETSTLDRAQAIAMKMQEESGVRHGVKSFYRNLDPQLSRCAILPNHPAAWHLKHTDINLSAFAATVLVRSGKLSPDMLVLHRPMEYDTFMDPANPLSAGAQVLFGALTSFIAGFIDVPREFGTDVVIALRAMSHPRQSYNRRAACRDAAVSALDPTTPADLDGSEGTSTSTSTENEVQPFQIENHEQVAGDSLDESTQEDTGDENDEDDGGVPVNEINRVQSRERKRSLQLKTAKPMSSSLAPSKPPRFIFLHETLLQGKKMSKKFAKVAIRLPADFSLGMTRGFHNAPKLYHDSTVTENPQVVNLRTGFTAAGEELRDGFYYSIKGIGTHPRDGYKKEGAKGLFKGVGKAVGGLFLKPAAGLWGIAGYPLSGILRDINDSLGRHQKCMIILGRIAQGVEEMKESTAQDRAEVFTTWKQIEHDLKKSHKWHAHHAGVPTST
ncbi:unnamed protein product [Penicillium pancosmium]